MAKLICIVDDSASVRNVVRIALTAAGYQVMEAVDGKDALSKLGTTKDRVHLIITDINMPNMDGITFTKEVRKLTQYRFTPVCVLTTEAGGSKMQEGKAAGAKAWIVKPFKPPMLLDAVSKLVA